MSTIARSTSVARRRAAALHPSPTGRAADRAQRRLEGQLVALALPLPASRIAAAMPAGTLLAAGAALLVLGPWGLAGAVIAAVAAAVLLRRGAPRRRSAATEAALPLVLDAVARRLRAGGSLAQSLVTAQPPPTAPDLQRSWARLSDLIPIGGVTVALEDWAAGSATVGGPGSGRSVRLAAAALSVAATTGGSPARAIDGVAATLRSRLAVAEEVRALSSQARASAVVIALAPLVFGLLAGATDPRTRGFLASPAGLVLLVLGLTLDATGATWMSRLCRAAS